jgi:hypothetical protein
LKQSIQINGYTGQAWIIGVDTPAKTTFDFYLSKINSVWLLDAILLID